MLSNSTFTSAPLRVFSGSVDVNNNTFSRTEPIYINPTYVGEIYNNIFLSDSLVNLIGGVTADTQFQFKPNLNRYRVNRYFTVESGTTLSIPSGITVSSSGQFENMVVNGTLKASGVNFTGSFNDIYVNNGGRVELTNGTQFAGEGVEFKDGSSGLIHCSTLNADLSIHSGSAIQIDRNTFLSGTVRARGDSTSTIDVSGNYWNTTDSFQIATRVEDHHDNSNNPTIAYAPFLYSPHHMKNMYGTTGSDYRKH